MKIGSLEITRRQWIKGGLLLLVGGLGGSLLWEIYKLESFCSQTDLKKGFTVVKKIPREQCNSLEEVLAPSGRTISTSGKTLEANAVLSDFPEIIYMFSSHFFDFFTFYVYVGNILILNKEGFYLAPRHCVLRGSQYANPKNSFYFDPLSNIVFRGEVLAYSGESDLALGKLNMDIPDHVTTHLYPEPIEERQYLFTLRYDNISNIKRFFKIAHYVYLKNNKDTVQLPENFDFEIAKSFKLSYEPGQAFSDMKISKIIKDGEKVRNIMEHFPPVDYVFTVESKSGHSGSPVYSLNGDLAGIITASPPNSHLFLSEEDDTPIDVSFMVGANSIRKFIGQYMDAVHEK